MIMKKLNIISAIEEYNVELKIWGSYHLDIITKGNAEIGKDQLIEHTQWKEIIHVTLE